MVVKSQRLLRFETEYAEVESVGVSGEGNGQFRVEYFKGYQYLFIYSLPTNHVG